MNILLIEDEWPSVYSGKPLRWLNIFKQISKRDNVHFLYIGSKPPKNTDLIKGLVCSIDSVNIEPESFFLWKLLNIIFPKPGAYARWRQRNNRLKVKKYISEIIRQKKIDIIHVFSYFTAQYCLDLNNIIKIWDVGDSYYLNNKREVQFNHFFGRIRKRLKIKKLYKYEQGIIKNFTKTVFVSFADANIHKNLKNKISVIPNGVDADYFIPRNDEGAYPSLIFTGHMDFDPNIKAVIYFIKEMLPLVKREYPEVKFYIVGADPKDEILKLNNEKNGIIVTGAVDDIRPYLSRATVFIAPMISGAGIKNKILQAMATAKPIVSSPLGIEALSVTDNEEVLIANTPLEFADKIITLLKDKYLRQSIGEKANLKARNEYSWNKTIDQYDSIYALSN